MEEKTKKIATKVKAKTRKTKSRAKKTVEPEYSIDQFVEAAGPLFGTRGIVVRVALQQGNKEMYTKEEAKEIVSEFMMKEVK